MKKFIAPLLLGLSALISCSKTKLGNESLQCKYTWDCSGDIPQGKVDIQSFFSRPRLLGLEETEESRVGRINKVVEHDTLLIVMDADQARRIFVFNSQTGRFLRTIASIGSGSNEYAMLNDFSLDEENGIIYILVNKQKIMKFDLEGNFQEKYDLPIFANKMEYLKGKFYFTCEQIGKGALIITDSQFNEIGSFFENTEKTLFFQFPHPMQKTMDGNLTYMRYLDNNIYHVDAENNTMSVLYDIDFGNNGLNLEDVEGMTFEQAESKAHKCRSELLWFTESDSQAWILFYEMNKPCLSVFDKNTGKCKTFAWSDMEDSYLESRTSFPEYATKDAFIGVLDNKSDEGETGEDGTYYGLNPMIYWLHL